MAAPRWRSPAALIDSLFQDPRRFEFFQAVRVLEWQARRDARDPRADPRRPIGHDHDPRREVVRLRTDISLAFPGNELTTAEAPEGGGGGTLVTSVMGLVGAIGVLPQHYTELLILQIRSRSRALRDFLDIFHHRSLSLFYRAWAKYRLPVAFERTGDGGAGGTPGAMDPVTTAVSAFVGLATPGLQTRLAIPDSALLHYSGLLSSEVRSEHGLRALLSDYLGRPIRVEAFVGSWLPIAVGEQSRLASPTQPQGQYARLGIDTVAGERAWDVHGRFRIRIGPLDYAQFQVFMPEGREMARLKDLTRVYVGPELDFEVEVTLQSAAVPELRLAAPGTAGEPRLGWNTWLLDGPSLRDRDDAVFHIDDL